MFTRDEIKETATALEEKTAEEILQWAHTTFHRKAVIATSFGLEDQAITQMACQTFSNPIFFTLDTGRLPQATYDLMQTTRERYHINIEICFPEAQEVAEMVEKYGPNLFYQSVDLRRRCCEVRKVNPLKKYLKDKAAWIVGLRREQGITRNNIKKVEWDESLNIVKIAPLADWSQERTWDYINKNKIPYNKLHDQGYTSIGCSPCTRAIKPGEDLRAGRWWWENPENKECGIHIVDGKVKRVAKVNQ